MPKGSRAIVSICADGGLGTVALSKFRNSRGSSHEEPPQPPRYLTANWCMKPVSGHSTAGG